MVRGTPTSICLAFPVWTVFHGDQIVDEGIFSKEFLLINPKGLENLQFSTPYEVMDLSNSLSIGAKNIRWELNEVCIHLKNPTNRSWHKLKRDNQIFCPQDMVQSQVESVTYEVRFFFFKVGLNLIKPLSEKEDDV